MRHVPRWGQIRPSRWGQFKLSFSECGRSRLGPGVGRHRRPLSGGSGREMTDTFRLRKPPDQIREHWGGSHGVDHVPARPTTASVRRTAGSVSRLCGSVSLRQPWGVPVDRRQHDRREVRCEHEASAVEVGAVGPVFRWLPPGSCWGGYRARSSRGPGAALSVASIGGHVSEPAGGSASWGGWQLSLGTGSPVSM